LGGIFLLKAIKLFCNGPMNSCSRNLKGNIIIITGANTGIGKENTIELSR